MLWEAPPGNAPLGVAARQAVFRGGHPHDLLIVSVPDSGSGLTCRALSSAHHGKRAGTAADRRASSTRPMRRRPIDLGVIAGSDEDTLTDAERERASYEALRGRVEWGLPIARRLEAKRRALRTAELTDSQSDSHGDDCL